MTRVLVVLLLVTGAAQARRVVRMPSLADLCPGGEQWDKVARCLARQGTIEIVHDARDAKLVRFDTRSRFSGFALYTRTQQWRLRGDVRLGGDHELLGIQRVAYGKHRGYRIDIGLASPTGFSLDDELAVPGLLRRRLAVVCFDDRAGCIQTQTACDALVAGKAIYSFRGVLVYQARQLKIVGDRRNAGPFCAQAELVMSDQ